jgi:hypothetical protein
MKNLLIFLIIVSAGLGVFYYQQTSICRNPLSYDIDAFDSRFGISKDKFLLAVKEAEGIWENGTHKNLFSYEPGGKLKISLIFDERQEITFEANESEEQLEGSREAYDALLNQYKIKEATYSSNLALYESHVSSFDSRLNSYNRKVAEANSRGGAKPDEYKALEEERKYIETLQGQLDRERVALNAEASQLNHLGGQVNDMAGQLNINVDIHNERFGDAREFDQGEYVNKRINIYQFETIADLRLVLAHELGHSIGINHVENPKSIMYYLMDKQSLQNPTLSPEDISAFVRRCEIKNILNLSFLSKFAF